MTSSKPTSEQTRERILEGALSLFALHGFAGATTRMVAQAAEVNVATLAYHFESKEKLYGAVLDHVGALLFEGMPRVPDGPVPLDAVATFLVHRGWTLFRANPDAARLLLRHSLDRGSDPDIPDPGYERMLERAEQIHHALRPDWTPLQCRVAFLWGMATILRLASEPEDGLRRLLRVEGDPTNELVRMLTRAMSAVLLLPPETR